MWHRAFGVYTLYNIYWQPGLSRSRLDIQGQPASSRPNSCQAFLCIPWLLITDPRLVHMHVQDADSQDSPCHPYRALRSPLCSSRCNWLGCNVESRLCEVLRRCELLPYSEMTLVSVMSHSGTPQRVRLREPRARSCLCVVLKHPRSWNRASSGNSSSVSKACQ